MESAHQHRSRRRFVSTRSYAILGTGAIGGFYGAKLQKAGVDVHFLLRSDYEFARDNGLQVESVQGDFTLPEVNAYRSVNEMPRCDVAIVALKTTQNHLLPDLIPPVLKDDGVVLVLQNGLGIEDEVARIVGVDRVLGGLCFICSHKVGPGRIRHLDYGNISIAEYKIEYASGGVTPRMHDIATDFETAGITIRLEPDLLLARWKKLVWNIPYNGLSVVLNAQTDELMQNAHTQRLVKQVMLEVTAAAAAYGRDIPATFVQKMLDDTAKMTPYSTSMKLDYDGGRSLEVEAIFGNTIRAAIDAGVAMPQVDMLYRQLKFLDRKGQSTV